MLLLFTGTYKGKQGQKRQCFIFKITNALIVGQWVEGCRSVARWGWVVEGVRYDVMGKKLNAGRTINRIHISSSERNKVIPPNINGLPERRLKKIRTSSVMHRPPPTTHD